MTDSMNFAITETNRRRAKQVKFNQEHGIVPVSIHKAIRDLTDSLSVEGRERAMAVGEAKAEYLAGKRKAASGTDRRELEKLIHEMETQMKEAAKALEFERAAALRDEIYELKAVLADDARLKPWERIKLLTGES
jgi:excinuclease ABC subunit B